MDEEDLGEDYEDFIEANEGLYTTEKALQKNFGFKKSNRIRMGQFNADDIDLEDDQDGELMT